MNLDVLLIDDIQIIARKEMAQEEFFHDLYQNGKKIIVSSNRPLREFSLLEKRFKNRFEKGLIAEIFVQVY